MSRRYAWGLGVTIFLGGVGVWGWRATRTKSSLFPDRQVAVVRGDIERTVLTAGDVRPRNRVEVKPPIAGRVEDILVSEGDRVRKGQILAWMSSTERAALLDAARAKGADELARWEKLYNPTPLVAPLAGTLIARNVEPGQTVSGAEAVLVMSDRLILKAPVDETDMAQIRLGQSVWITLDAFPREKISGRVEHIAFEAKTVNNVTVYEVDVLPESVPPFMRSGMSANLIFRVSEKQGVLLLPAAAVKTEGDQTVVTVSQGKGKKETRVITLGLSNGKQVEVESGLAEGDRVWIAGGGPAIASTQVKTSPLSPPMRRPGRRVR